MDMAKLGLFMAQKRKNQQQQQQRTQISIFDFKICWTSLTQLVGVSNS